MQQELIQSIERLLDEQVRPTLRLHGGNLRVESCEDGVLRVQFLGNCSGCPSAELTIKGLVEEKVCTAIKAVNRVEMEQRVSETLLEEARQRLMARAKR